MFLKSSRPTNFDNLRQETGNKMRPTVKKRSTWSSFFPNGVEVVDFRIRRLELRKRRNRFKKMPFKSSKFLGAMKNGQTKNDLNYKTQKCFLMLLITWQCLWMFHLPNIFSTAINH